MNIPINIEILLRGKGTGIPTIKKAIDRNGSPAPIYDTDGDKRRYFFIELPIHLFFTGQDRGQDSNLQHTEKEIYKQMSGNERQNTGLDRAR